MKKYCGNVTKYQKLINIILSMALVLAVVLTVSCQSEAPAPAPYVPSDGTPLAPTTGEPEPPASPPQIEVLIDGSAFIPATYDIPVGAIVIWYNN